MTGPEVSRGLEDRSRVIGQSFTFSYFPGCTFVLTLNKYLFELSFTRVRYIKN